MVAAADVRCCVTNTSFIFFSFPPYAVSKPSSSLNPRLLANSHSWLKKLSIPSCFRRESIAFLLLQTRLLIPLFCRDNPIFIVFFSPPSQHYLKQQKCLGVLRSESGEKSVYLIYNIYWKPWKSLCVCLFLEVLWFRAPFKRSPCVSVLNIRSPSC